jgi:transcriptional regulator with XRE-family HTH domain
MTHDFRLTNGHHPSPSPTGDTSPSELESDVVCFHRLGEVRRHERISRRTVSRQLGISISDVARQEDGTTDLRLSVFYQWQRVLKVPVADLLVQPNDSLSPPVMRRAQLIQLMKTAVSIVQQSSNPSVRRMARRMVDQLLEIMPELAAMAPLPAAGRQRGPDEHGCAGECTPPDQIFK